MSQQDNEIRLVIDEQTYAIDPDDLELGEVELIEDEMGVAVQDVDFNRAKAMRVLSYILIHRNDRSFTMDDARKLKLSSFGDVEEPAEEKPKRPTRAAKAPTAS